jgi:dienelactone hydrolase
MAGRLIGALLLAAAALPAGAQRIAPQAESQTVPLAVRVPSTSDAVDLPGTWFAAPRPPGAPRAPALVLLHGCSGLADSRGRLAARYTELAGALNALGIHALAVDSLTPRGERELCTQRIGSRRVTQRERRRDALAALAWLAERDEVDPARIGLLGWSNGGSTVLAATNLNHAEVAAARRRPSLAVAFYPGCEAERARGYRPSAPLLMLLGEADDWTPAAPCKALAAAVTAPAAADTAEAPRPQWEAYAGAYHGFDGAGAVRHRRDVPGGARPGAGVHVGGNPAAREAARERLVDFLRRHWKLAP